MRVWCRRAACGRVVLAALASWMLGASPAIAQQADEFSIWLQGLRQEAATRGISTKTLDVALAHVQPIDRVIELDHRQPEFTQTFWDYLDKRVTPERIERARRLLHENYALLAKAEQRYGVPPRFLVAFWGLETNFGDYLGNFPVIDALATLAYDNRRSNFFRQQVFAALGIIDAGHANVQDMRGSWAGAMGHLQFIPTTYAQYAVDANGDGREDVWHSLPDVFYSGANYLNKLGWKRNQTWGREVRLPKDFRWSLARPEIKRPIAVWAALGVRRADGRRLPKASFDASVVLPQGYAGPAFLVYDNFQVILHWNRSVNYAIAVGHLADRMVGLPALRNGRQADNRALTRADAIELQQRLQAHGYDVGHADGVTGAKTWAAVRAYQQAQGLPADGYPSMSLLERLRRNAPAVPHQG